MSSPRVRIAFRLVERRFGGRAGGSEIQPTFLVQDDDRLGPLRDGDQQAFLHQLVAGQLLRPAAVQVGERVVRVGFQATEAKRADS